ncbi:MAG: malate/lactate/ureidoglycolate dehydrogenase [Arenibacterium sp.]
MRFTAQSLTDIARDILVAADVSEPRAQMVAERLVTANLCGHDSHGIGMVPKYVEGLRSGGLDPDADAVIHQDHAQALLVDGARGFGQIVGAQAMEWAIERALKSKLHLLSLRNAFHIARIGDWAEMAASAGLISIHYVNVISASALVAPFGGSAARFSTNPYCTGIPAGPDQPMFLLDMATSQIAHGKARVAHLSGKQTPPGALIDADGRLTQDPAVLFEEPMGALTTFGEHKGFGLAMLGDLLGGALSGGMAAGVDRAEEGAIINNMTVILIDPDIFGAADAFYEEMRSYLDWVKSSPPAPERDAVLIPGDPERIARQARSANGIVVDPGTVAQLQETADLVGLQRSIKDTSL